jgi:hypothetical protein
MAAASRSPARRSVAMVGNFSRIYASSRNAPPGHPLSNVPRKRHDPFAPRRQMMKTLTTLTAVVALIAGISVASAAGMSTMNKDKATGTSSMSKSARVIGTSKYCSKSKTGELNCKFASLSACQKGANGETCSVNPNIGTTGSK